MSRYRIIYNKRGYPLTSWAKTAEEAHETAEKLRFIGYYVTVWEYTETGSKKMNL